MLLFTERDLPGVPASCPVEGAPTLCNDLRTAGTAEELATRIRTAIVTAGFEWMSYRLVAFRGGIVIGTRMFCSHANAGWVTRYCEEWKTTLDPLAQLALRSSIPIAWSVADVESWRPAAATTADEHRYLQLVQSCGIESGVIAALPIGPQPVEHILFELHSSSRGHGWITENVLTRAFMLGMCVHELFVARARFCANEKVRSISATQREILRHLVHGRSNKQIAHALQMSGDTVKYHLRELQRHFKARNRMQLVNSILLTDEP